MISMSCEANSGVQKTSLYWSLKSPGKAGVKDGGNVGKGVPVGVGDFVGVRVGLGVKVAWGISVIAIVGESDGEITGVWIDASCSEVEVGSLTVSSGRYRINNAPTNTIMKTAPRVPNKISCLGESPALFSEVDCSGSDEVIASYLRILIVESLAVQFYAKSSILDTCSSVF
jgi:hypothetical protein